MRSEKRLSALTAAMNAAYDVAAWRMPGALPWETPCLLFSMLSIGLMLATSWAQSPLVAELRTLAVTYHKDPARLDQVRQGLERAITSDGGAENLLALAQVCFIWGDVRTTSRAQKLAAYDRGRQAAKRVVELAPRNVLAHFWYATNTARWGQTKGVVRSLFLLPTVQEEIQII